MQNTLASHPYVKEIIDLECSSTSRIEFHEKSHPILLKMGSDQEFLKQVIKRNFRDEGFINHKWSGFNIPFFYIYETDDFVLKIHLFPSDKERRNNLAANCVHHHNNYILSTNAFFGSGYECFLFSNNPQVDENLEVKMKIAKRFHQKDWNPHIVKAWQPHVVIAPQSFSATLVLWTPDEKRTTDKLRQHPLLKPIKKQLKWLAYRLGLANKIGVAAENTYQFYPNGTTFKGVAESEYVAPMLAEVGDEVDNYCMQMMFYFLQKADLVERDLLRNLANNSSLPSYYYKWIDKVLNDEEVDEVFHAPNLNIPQKQFFVEDILKAAS
ncbi:MAG: hypothetical protein JKY53_01170 [Flavobacteriales bacterium]|nr:hypothetical protein [Flavobacteriales bacterium]